MFPHLDGETLEIKSYLLFIFISVVWEHFTVETSINISHIKLNVFNLFIIYYKFYFMYNFLAMTLF